MRRRNPDHLGDQDIECGGVFPVAPTVFDERGDLDLEGQKRCIDFMIDAVSQGICILANWSEQFVLADAERERVMACC